MTDRLPLSVDILTPEFKARIDALNEEYEHEGETLRLYATPSSEDVTIEQMQDSAYALMRDRRAGVLRSSPRPRETPHHNITIEDFLND